MFFLLFVLLVALWAGAEANSPTQSLRGLLGGSWVVISGVISKVTIDITHIEGTYNHTHNYP